MDHEIFEGSSKGFSQAKLIELRREKLRKEIESAKRLIENGIEPLQIADSFFHDIFRIMENGFYRRNPELSKEEINHKIEDVLNFVVKLKAKRRRRGVQ